MSMGDISLVGLAILVGATLVALVAFVSVAMLTDDRAQRHPYGRQGLLQDRALVLAPIIAVFGVVVVWGEFSSGSFFRVAVLVILSLGLLAYGFVPQVRRAGQRLRAFHRYPPQ